MRCGLIAAAPIVFLGACSFITVQQQPFQAMTVNAVRPDKPPPRVVLMPSSIRITEKIQFGFDSADIKTESHSLLDEIAKVFAENPQIVRVQIEGHTDGQGASGYNRRLSRQRAESVRAYLIGKGIAVDRLSAKGFGPDQPLTDGTEEADHELNRRVEFNILKQEDKRVLVEEE